MNRIYVICLYVVIFYVSVKYLKKYGIINYEKHTRIHAFTKGYDKMENFERLEREKINDEKISEIEILNNYGTEITAQRLEREKKIQEKINTYLSFSDEVLETKIKQCELNEQEINNYILDLKKQLYQRRIQNINIVYLMAEKFKREFSYSMSFSSGMLDNAILTKQNLEIFTEYLDKLNYWVNEDDFIQYILNNIKEPITINQITTCKENMLNDGISNKISLNYSTILEMWKPYDNISEEEFKIKVDKKCDELHNFYQGLENLRVKIYNQFSNSFDLLGLFYNEISSKSDNFLKVNYLFDKDDLNKLHIIKEKLQELSQINDDICSMLGALSQKNPIEDTINELNNMLDNIQIDEVHCPELDGKSPEEQKRIKEQWLSDIKNQPDLDQIKEELRKKMEQKIKNDIEQMNNFINN